MVINIGYEIPDNEWWTQNKRGHWRVKYAHTSAVKARATLIARSAKQAISTAEGRSMDRPAFTRCHVTAYVAYPTNNRADPENAAPMVKAILDAMTETGWWPDDDSRHLIGPDYRRDPEKTRKGWHRITMRIEELDDEQ